MVSRRDPVGALVPACVHSLGLAALSCMLRARTSAEPTGYCSNNFIIASQLPGVFSWNSYLPPKPDLPMLAHKIRNVTMFLQ